MNKRNFLASVMKEINCNLDSLSERILFQKKMYLLRGMGLPLEYRFIWWRFGPYSSSMAHEAFSIDGLEREINLKKYENILRNFKEFSISKEKDVEFFEVVASILFLKKNNSGDILEQLLQLKPHLSAEKVEFVLRRLKEFEII